jgi:hypothetical protein
LNNGHSRQLATEGNTILKVYANTIPEFFCCNHEMLVEAGGCLLPFGYDVAKILLPFGNNKDRRHQWRSVIGHLFNHQCFYPVSRFRLWETIRKGSFHDGNVKRSVGRGKAEGQKKGCLKRQPR